MIKEPVLFAGQAGDCAGSFRGRNRHADAVLAAEHLQDSNMRLPVPMPADGARGGKPIRAELDALSQSHESLAHFRFALRQALYSGHSFRM